VVPTEEHEAEFLKAHAASLKAQLESIDKRLDELERAE
jgi:chaperonin cofactor prefoldin